VSARVAIIGLGLHGARIACVLLDDGHDLIGAADPSLAGRPLSAVVDHPRAPSSAVLAEAADLLRERPRADVAIVAAGVDLAELKRICGPLLRAGVNVLTINEQAFDPDDAWAAAIDEHARAGRASFLATGVQDAWWVHVPAVAASSVRALRRVVIDSDVDIASLSIGYGELFGVGQPRERFLAVREALSSDETVLGGPLRVLARRLGLQPGRVEARFEPCLAERACPWPAAGVDVPTGTLLGYAEHTVVPTVEGVVLEGTFTTVLMEPGRSSRDRVTLEGDPVLHLEHRPFPGDRITDIVPAARVEDIRLASPGFHTAGTLPPPRYRHRPARD
jgi:hypothetical protein